MRWDVQLSDSKDVESEKVQKLQEKLSSDNVRVCVCVCERGKRRRDMSNNVE